MTLIPRVLFGTLREHYVLLFGAASSIALIAGFVGAWFGARFGARAAARRALHDASADLASGRQLRSIAEGVDSLMVEVERVSEAQRFVAKLLAERERAAVAPMPVPQRREQGHITPH